MATAADILDPVSDAAGGAAGPARAGSTSPFGAAAAGARPLTTPAGISALAARALAAALREGNPEGDAALGAAAAEVAALAPADAYLVAEQCASLRQRPFSTNLRV